MLLSTYYSSHCHRISTLITIFIALALRPCKAKRPPPPTRPLTQTGRDRSAPASCSAPDEGDLVRHGAPDVKQDIVRDEERPGSDGESAEDDL